MSSILNEESLGSARQSLGGVPIDVPTIRALRKLVETDFQGMAFVEGGTTAGDGGGGIFYWNPNDTSADNGTSVVRPAIIPASNPGRWDLLSGFSPATPVDPNINNVKSFGAIGDGASHLLSSAQAAAYNASYGSIGLVAAAGDENDWAAIQACLYQSSVDGKETYAPAGTYLTNKPLLLEWIFGNFPHPPPSGQPQTPLIGTIRGDGQVATTIQGIIATPGRAILELLGYGNYNGVRINLLDLRLKHTVGTDLGSYCLRMGDAMAFYAEDVFCEGVNCLILRTSALATGYSQINTHFVNCRFEANFFSNYIPVEANARVLSVNYELVGVAPIGKWDNVYFGSCFFFGTVYPRANTLVFDNCIYETDSRRPTDANIQYSACVDIRSGSANFYGCYFEDYLTAINIKATVDDIRHVSINGCWMDAAINRGSTLPQYGVHGVANPGVFKTGCITVRDCDLNTPGHTISDVALTGGLTYEVSWNENITDPDDFISTNFSGGSQGECIQKKITGGNQRSFRISTLNVDAFHQLQMEVDNSVAHVSGAAGTDNNYAWGKYWSNFNSTDSTFMGATGPNYTNAGAQQWQAVGNNDFFLGLTTGGMKMCFDPADATSFVQFSGAATTFPTNLVARNMAAIATAAYAAANGNHWGLLSYDSSGNSFEIGWSGTNYTTGGAEAWIGNNVPFFWMHQNTAFKMGWTGQATNFYTFYLTGLTLGGTMALSVGGSGTFGSTVACTNALVIDGADATLRMTNIYNTGVQRWAFGGNNTATSGGAGGATGDDFDLYYYNNSGAFLATALRIFRASGHVLINATVDDLSGNFLQVNGGVSMASGVVAGNLTVHGSMGVDLDLYAGGYIYMNTPGTGVRLTSPNGLVQKIVTIDNAGALVLL